LLPPDREFNAAEDRYDYDGLRCARTP
jgi:hypothetical protein